jgi:hypothetical protein
LPEQVLESHNVSEPVPPEVLTGPRTAERVLAERRVRAELRRQIALLERRLGELFAAAFPRKEIEWRVGSGAYGPRVLGVAELEAVRDALAGRLREAEAEVARRGRIEERNRQLLEEMIAAPERHRGLLISAADIGESSCRTWRSAPRLGLIGMLMGWWRVKISSGCPLATGAAARAAPHSLRPPSAALRVAFGAKAPHRKNR